MKAYKGFKPDMKAYNGFQYKEGETYEMEESPICGERGFHACEIPLDSLINYSPRDYLDYVYHEVELEGTIDRKLAGITRVAASNKITIGPRVSLKELIKAHIEVVLKDHARILRGLTHARKMLAAAKDNLALSADSSNKIENYCAASSGHNNVTSIVGRCSTVATSGNSSISAASGEQNTTLTAGRRCVSAISSFGGISIASGTGSVAVAVGNATGAITTQKNSVAVSHAFIPLAKGVIGSYLVLIKYDSFNPDNDIQCAKMIRIDGKRYKPNTWYTIDENKVVQYD